MYFFIPRTFLFVDKFICSFLLPYRYALFFTRKGNYHQEMKKKPRYIYSLKLVAGLREAT